MGPASIWSHNNTNDTCTRGIRNVTCGIIYIFSQFLETFSGDFGSHKKFIVVIVSCDIQNNFWYAYFW